LQLWYDRLLNEEYDDDDDDDDDDCFVERCFTWNHFQSTSALLL